MLFRFAKIDSFDHVALDEALAPATTDRIEHFGARAGVPERLMTDILDKRLASFGRERLLGVCWLFLRMTISLVR